MIHCNWEGEVIAKTPSLLNAEEQTNGSLTSHLPGVKPQLIHTNGIGHHRDAYGRRSVQMGSIMISLG